MGHWKHCWRLDGDERRCVGCDERHEMMKTSPVSMQRNGKFLCEGLCEWRSCVDGFKLDERKTTSTMGFGSYGHSSIV